MNETIVLAGGILSTFFFCFVLWVTLTVAFSFLRRKTYAAFEPPLSVIIPVFNEERAITATIEGIFASKYDPAKLEVIVVDDGSTDNTPRLLLALQRKYPALRVVQGRHEGKSAALNLGLTHASHELFVGLDGDTVLDPHALARIIEPLQDEAIFASNGTCSVLNRTTILGSFQHLEYTYNNLVRQGFSDTYRNGIWFLGFFAAYRKSVILRLGGFKKRSLTEDIDIALEIYNAGGRIAYVKNAIGYTNVPDTVRSLIKQRIRWTCGALQSLAINRSVLTKTLNPSVLFLFVHQSWLVVYGLLFLPLLAYQLWFAAGFTTFLGWFLYAFLWFTFLGPLTLVLLMPVWGVSAAGMFGVTTVISTLLFPFAFRVFKEKFSPRYALALFLYFPYTVFLNVVLVLSLVSSPFQRKYFIRESSVKKQVPARAALPSDEPVPVSDQS